jgi:hypothetical protein
MVHGEKSMPIREFAADRLCVWRSSCVPVRFWLVFIGMPANDQLQQQEDAKNRSNGEMPPALQLPERLLLFLAQARRFPIPLATSSRSPPASQAKDVKPALSTSELNEGLSKARALMTIAAGIQRTARQKNVSLARRSGVEAAGSIGIVLFAIQPLAPPRGVPLAA